MKNNNKFLGASYKRQKGITMWSFAFVVGVIGLFFYIGINLVPVYSENVAMKDALEASLKNVGRAEVRKKKIIETVDKRLYIDGYYDVPDLNEVLKVEKKRTGTKVTLEYKKEVPLFYNIGIYLDFKHVIEK